jgi:hypothetical protein
MRCPNFAVYDRAERRKSRKFALRATMRSFPSSFRTVCKNFAAQPAPNDIKGLCGAEIRSKTSAIRPLEASKVAVGYDRFTSTPAVRYAPTRLSRRRLDRIQPGCIDRDPAHRERDRQRSGTKQRHEPERSRAERAVERTGHQCYYGGPRTDRDAAVYRLSCRSQGRGTITDSICMQARCNRANVRPCSGSTGTIAGGQAVTAVTLQRTIPALAASAAAPAGPSHFSSAGPATAKTTTSARTPSDHKSPSHARLDAPLLPAQHLKAIVQLVAAENQRRQRH